MAGLLRRGRRPSDIVARYRGDEVVVVLAWGTLTTMTVSVGVAAFPRDGETADALIEAVDRAQYAAERSGGNRVRVAHVVSR